MIGILIGSAHGDTCGEYRMWIHFGNPLHSQRYASSNKMQSWLYMCRYCITPETNIKFILQPWNVINHGIADAKRTTISALHWEDILMARVRFLLLSCSLSLARFLPFAAWVWVCASCVDGVRCRFGLKCRYRLLSYGKVAIFLVTCWSDSLSSPCTLQKIQSSKFHLNC